MYIPRLEGERRRGEERGGSIKILIDRIYSSRYAVISISGNKSSNIETVYIYIYVETIAIL